jgi:hypothetical protein
MKQEAFMSLYRIAGSWKRLKDGVFQWCGLVNDKGTSFDLIGAEMSSDRQNSDVQTSVIRPDDHGRRSEFSLHIGC